MSAWAGRAAAAWRLAGDRSGLWPAGALAWLVYLGWLPFILAVAPPTPGGLSHVGVTLLSSGAYPANVIALSAAAVGAFLLFCLLAAMAEAFIGRSPDLRPLPRDRRPPGSATLAGLAILLVATVPALAGLAALVVAATAVAPSEFMSPEGAGTLFARLARALLPQLMALGLAILVGQAFGGIALRRAALRAEPDLPATLAGAAADLVRGGWGPLGVAVAALLKDAAMAVVAYALLRVLWEPISVGLAGGAVGDPRTLLLLVGFVAIWLSLLLAAGALHVAVSAWWGLELQAAAPIASGEGSRRQPTV